MHQTGRSPLPYLKTGHPTLNSAFRAALGDLIGNIQPFQDGLLDAPQRCILAGLEYDTPWTRDAAINVWNGAGLIFPEAARSTLLAVLEERDGSLFIGGQYWDSIIWTTGAWAYYLYTGDREMLVLAMEVSINSLAYFEETEFNPETGLFRGPACYGDGVAAYPDRYAQTNGSSSILDWSRHNPELTAPAGYGIPMQALSTNCLYYNAYRLLGKMAAELGQSADPAWAEKAAALKSAIHQHFWNDQKGIYRYLVDPWGGCDHQEGLGNCFALLFGLASPEQVQKIIRNQQITAAGIPCVWPTFARYHRTPDSFGRHSGTVWPHIQGFWAEAAARHGAVEKFRSELLNLAAFAARDGMFAEIYHPQTGKIYGGLQEGAPDWQWHSCLRQTWSATGFLRMVLMGIAGMDFSPEGISFHPTMPEGIDLLELDDLPYRGQMLHLKIAGQGTQIKSFTINGQYSEMAFLSASGEGRQRVEIQMERGR